MPRDGSGVASKPPGSTAAANTTIASAKFNAVIDDIYAEMNLARPVTAGGTGETTARLKDGTWRFQNTTDTTKLLAFDLSKFPTATTRTITFPPEGLPNGYPLIHVQDQKSASASAGASGAPLSRMWARLGCSSKLNRPTTAIF